jgi:predicted PP-loop superfamily ATPase
MLQIAFIRENQEKVIQALAKEYGRQKYCGRCHKLDTERCTSRVRRYFS